MAKMGGKHKMKVTMEQGLTERIVWSNYKEIASIRIKPKTFLVIEAMCREGTKYIRIHHRYYIGEGNGYDGFIDNMRRQFIRFEFNTPEGYSEDDFFEKFLQALKDAYEYMKEMPDVDVNNMIVFTDKPKTKNLLPKTWDR